MIGLQRLRICRKSVRFGKSVFLMIRALMRIIFSIPSHWTQQQYPCRRVGLRQWCRCCRIRFCQMGKRCLQPISTVLVHTRIFRRRHLMSELLQWSFSRDIQHKIAASILIPQEKWLFDFYRPFGYQPAFTLHTIAFTEQQPIMQKGLRAMTPQDLPACEALYRSQLADCPLTVLRTPEQWQAQLPCLKHWEAVPWYSNMRTRFWDMPLSGRRRMASGRRN